MNAGKKKIADQLDAEDIAAPVILVLLIVAAIWFGPMATVVFILRAAIRSALWQA